MKDFRAFYRLPTICVLLSNGLIGVFVVLNVLQEPLPVGISELRCEETASDGSLSDRNPKWGLENVVSSNCETAWQRVLSRIDNNESNDLIRFEFCRFLGVLETAANVSLPDFMLGLQPMIVDPQYRRILAFHYPFLGGTGKTSDLTTSEDHERNVGVTEKFRNLEGISYLVSGHDGDVFVPQDENSGPIAIENHRNLSNNELAVLLSSGNGCKLAVYERSDLLPRWSAIVKMTDRAQIITTGPRFKRTAIIETEDSLAVLEIGSMEFSLSTFGRKTGELLFHFAMQHDRASKDMEEIPKDVQKRTMSKSDLDE